jgi:MFS family permease
MLMPILPLYAKILTGSTASAVSIFAFRDIIQIFMRIPSGSLSDRIGRKPVMLLGAGCLTITQLLYYFSNNFLSLTGAVILQGLGMALYNPPSQTLFSELAPKGKLGETIGYWNMTMGLRSLVAPVAGGLLAESFPTYRPIFLITCSITLIGGLLIASFLPETNPQKEKSHYLSELKSALKHIVEIPKTLRISFSNRKILSASIAGFVRGFITGPFNSYFTIYASGIGLSESVIGSFYTARSLPTFSTPLLGRVSDRIGRLTPILTGLLSYLILLALIPSTSNYLLLLLLFVGLGISGRLTNISTMAGVAEGSVKGKRGAGLGVWGTMLRLGMAFGSLVIGAFVSYFPINWVFYFASSVGILGIILIIFTSRRGK